MSDTNKQLAIIQSDEIKGVVIANNERDGVKGVMASTANQNTLRFTIKAAVAKAFIATGKEFDKDILIFIIDELKAEILRSYPTIRLEEIGLAIHKGSVGDYGQIYNLSLNAFVGFIRTYMNSEARTIATKEFLKIDLEKPQNKPSDEEIEKGRRQSILDAFEKYKRTGTYKDYGNYIYNILANYGILNFTEDDKKVIWKSGKARVFNDLQAKAFRGGFEAHEAHLKIQEVKDDPEHILFYIEAKKIAICMFFEELVKMETELSDLLSTE